MAFRELSQAEIFSIPKQETETKIENVSPKKFSDIVKNFDKQALGVGRGLTQGATFGQASQLSGITNELANLPKKLYRATSINDLMKLYKDTGKDYVKGREQFKQEYNDWADKNKGLALGSELLGGIGTIGSSGLLKGLSFASKPFLNTLVKGATEGGVLGGLYNASNTEGKSIDLEGLGKGALFGAGAGAVMPLGITGLSKFGRFWNKGVDNFADKLTPAKFVKNPLKQATTVAEEKLPTTQKVDILANPKNIEDSFVHSRVQDYLPEQNFVVEYMKKDNNIVKELASGKDVGRRFGEYGEQAVNKLKDVKNVIKNAENEAYKKAGVTDDYMLDGRQFFDDIDNAINNFKQNPGTYATDENIGDKFMENVLDELTKNDGKISFGKLKRFTSDVNKKKNQVAKDLAKGKGSSEYQLWSDFSKAISKAKRTDPKLKAPTEMYSEISDALEDFQANTGINFDKPKQFARNIFASARDRADGGVYEQALEDLMSVLNKYEGTKVLGDLPSKIRMAKVSYVLRPSIKDSKLSRDIKGVMTPQKYAKRKFAETLVGKPISSEEYYRILADRMLKGEITPKDLEGTFRRVSFKGMSDDEANEMFVKYMLLGKRAGGPIPSIFSEIVKSGWKK